MNHDELDRFIESPDGQRAIELSREFRTIMAKHNMLEGTVNGVGCNAMSLQSRLDNTLGSLEIAGRRIAELEKQLPAEMQDCTIRFLECEVGHGRLTADNWIDSGCPWCRLQGAEKLLKLVWEFDVRVEGNGLPMNLSKAVHEWFFPAGKPLDVRDFGAVGDSAVERQEPYCGVVCAYFGDERTPLLCTLPPGHDGTHTHHFKGKLNL